MDSDQHRLHVRPPPSPCTSATTQGSPILSEKALDLDYYGYAGSSGKISESIPSPYSMNLYNSIDADWDIYSSIEVPVDESSFFYDNDQLEDPCSDTEWKEYDFADNVTILRM